MRIALGVEYDGTDFLGWQSQEQQPTVQCTLEQALSFVANESIRVICAGRTDTGVHAACQVVHFDTLAQRSPRAWMLGANSRLPSSVAVRWVQPVNEDFHARYGARARRYRYVILNRTPRPALEARYVTWEHQTLNVAEMQCAAQALIGEHDFSAFRTLACQSRTPVRKVQEISITQMASKVEFEIQANAFLHHMVRNIVGSLLLVGRGDRPVTWIAELLAGRNRALAGPTAPATGLVFLHPLYSREWGLPEEVCWQANDLEKIAI